MASGPLPGTFIARSRDWRHAAAATVPRHTRGEVFGSTRPAPDERSPYRPAESATVRHHGDVVSVLARNAREVEAAAQRGRVTPAVRTKFQAIALLLRDERARVRAAGGSNSHGTEQLRRLDGIATILATTAVRDAGLMALLGEDADVSDAARSLKREMLRDLGIEAATEEIAPAETATVPAGRSGKSCRNRWSPGNWRTPSWPPTSPPFRSAPPVRAAWPAGNCSARC